MSRAFVKDDGPDEQPLVPPRPPLPPGVPNYVTPRGFSMLKEELTELETLRGRLQADTDAAGAHAQDIVVLTGRIAELAARISGSKVIDPRRQPQGEVRFGATVTLRTVGDDSPGGERTLTIVGVDEAAVSDGKVAFLSPVARAITGRRSGEQVTVNTPAGDELLEICGITYEGR